MPELQTTVELGSLSFRGAISPKSLNADQRTVEIVWSTGAPVTRYDYTAGERYIERLSMDKAHVRLDRLNTIGPLLDSHSGWSVRHQLGAVVPGSVDIVGKQGRCVVQFSRRPEVDGIWGDVSDGLVRTFSVAYDVHAYEERAAQKRALKERLAIDWEPYEVSLVPMPADAGAQVRDGTPSLGTHPCLIVPAGMVRSDSDRERSLRLARARVLC